MQNPKNRIQESYPDSLTEEFNQLIKGVSTEVINSTALKALEKTTYDLNLKIPHLERISNGLDSEIKRLARTNTELDRLKLSETADRVEKTNQSIESLNIEFYQLQEEQRTASNAIIGLEKRIIDQIRRDIIVINKKNEDNLLKAKEDAKKSYYIIIAIIFVLVTIF